MCYHIELKAITITIKKLFYIQVCSSDFVTGRWVDHLFFNDSSFLFYPLDVRKSISAQFQTLATLCHNSQLVVSNGLASFATTKVVIPAMLPMLAFNSQVELLVNDAQNTLLDEQQRKSLMIRLFSDVTQLSNALLTNYLHTVWSGLSESHGTFGGVSFVE